jgi:GH24 family phage-related lysozyme (muramidase)
MAMTYRRRATISGDVPALEALPAVVTCERSIRVLCALIGVSDGEVTMPPTFEEIKMLIAPSEGNVSHMYLDTTGNVTVGIGNMLPDASAACALAFRNRTTGNKASAAEITADFRTVSAQPDSRPARFYRPFTKLDLPDVEINQLFRERVSGFQQELRGSYSDYDSYPSSVQLALLDMAFNLGTGGLKNKWPKLNKAIDEENWATAALESFRPGASPSRNSAVRGLFEAAAAESK